MNRTLTQKDASNNCSSLSEALLDPSSINTTALFSWLGYLDNTLRLDQQYWIENQKGDNCSAISPLGQRTTPNCSEPLPALCRSTAPIADQFNANTAEKWQITVNSLGQQLKGYRDKRSFRFLGVRYADKPVRFTHSQQFTTAGEYDATKYAPECMQGEGDMSEDCLFLNIWTPYLPRKGDTSTHLKPVLFWIHGGAFAAGSGSDPTFDGGNYASRGDVVMVSINYRLGNLGFLAIDGTSATGNYGFGDMITALDWVQTHISDFGGDRNRITVGGQSAGAAAVRAMLGSPKAAGKFSAAIMQSNLGGQGFAHPYSSYMTVKDYQANHTNTILDQIKCNGHSSLPCAQKTDASVLLNCDQAAFLIQDGTYITMPELSLNHTQSITNVPVLMGQMQGDAVFFIDDAPETANLTAAIADTPWNSSVVTHPEDFAVAFPNNTVVRDMSTNSTDPDLIAAVYNTTVTAGNDAMFRCVGQATAYAGSLNSVLGPIFYYEIERSYLTYPSRPACNAPVEPDFPFGNPEHQTYKCHSGDNFFTFGNVAFLKMADRDGHDITFAQVAMDSWASFVRTGNPNPSTEFLRAKGFEDVIGVLEESGSWNAVNASGPAKRLLDWQSVEVGFNEGSQCEDLGLGLRMFD